MTKALRHRFILRSMTEIRSEHLMTHAYVGAMVVSPIAFTQSQRTAALSARILASVAPNPITSYEIRKTVEADPDYAWTTPKFIWDTVTRLVKEGRLVRSTREGRAVVVFGLPIDPIVPFARFDVSPEERTRRELAIIAGINWPKFFHIPRKEQPPVHVPDVDYIVRA